MHSFVDIVANRSRTWLRLIVLFGLELVKPSTFTELHKENSPELEESRRTFRVDSHTSVARQLRISATRKVSDVKNTV